MKKVILLAMLFSAIAPAQYFLPTGTEILPSADHTLDGFLYIFSTDLSARGSISHNNNNGLTLNGSNAHNTGILLLPGVGGTVGTSSVIVQSTNTTDPGLVIKDGNNGANTNGIAWVTSIGTSLARMTRNGVGNALLLDILAAGGPVLRTEDTVINRQGNYAAGTWYFYTNGTGNLWSAVADNGTTGLLRLADGTGSGGCNGLGDGTYIVTRALQMCSVGGQIGVSISSTGTGGSTAGFATVWLGGLPAATLTSSGGAGILEIFNAASGTQYANLTSGTNGGLLNINNTSGLVRGRFTMDAGGDGEIDIFNGSGTQILTIGGGSAQAMTAVNGGVISGIGSGTTILFDAISGVYATNAVPGVNCSGTPSAGFTVAGGIVTHC